MSPPSTRLTLTSNGDVEKRHTSSQPSAAHPPPSQPVYPQTFAFETAACARSARTRPPDTAPGPARRCDRRTTRTSCGSIPDSQGTACSGSGTATICILGKCLGRSCQQGLWRRVMRGVGCGDGREAHRLLRSDGERRRRRCVGRCGTWSVGAVVASRLDGA